MQQFSADYVFPGNSSSIKNGVVVTDDAGVILALLNPEQDEISWENVKKYQGIICPGFINTHCHLELSYLREQINEKTQLHGFIKEIIAKRELFDDKHRLKAIVAAEIEMKKNGIVAVGDISNGTTTFDLKSKNNLYYHTFVEVFGSDPTIANIAFEHSLDVYNSYFNKKQVSLTPHATYSVSDPLTNLINEHCIENNSIMSFHNQETASENEFFKSGTGQLFDFLNIAEKTKAKFTPSQLNALPSFLGKYKELTKILLVHNTYTDAKDIEWANSYSKNIYWAFCPNANVYIEDCQPNYQLFLNEKCTIGTDSLASNWSLSVLDELKTISQNTPEIPLETLIKWATIYGAEFLEIEKQFGSIEHGKKPGINLIEKVNLENLTLTPRTSVKVLI